MNTETPDSLQCEPCQSGLGRLNQADLAQYLTTINQLWEVSNNGTQISRSFTFKNFAKTMFFVNAIAHMADQQGHHPDIEFGYNYCRVKYTTHEAGGLTVNDFICAKRVDKLI